MATTEEDKNLRYFIDLDLKTRSLVNWGSDDRYKLVQVLPKPLHRIFLTKGQFSKFERSIEN